MEVIHDIQQRIFDAIKLQLPKDEKIASVLMNTLFLSQDAVYRRLRGDVPLTIFETKTLCEAFNISFDEMDSYKKVRVSFTYQPLDRIGLNFESWLTGLRDGLKQIRNMENTSMIMSINDTPIFQLFNLPHEPIVALNFALAHLLPRSRFPFGFGRRCRSRRAASISVATALAAPAVTGTVILIVTAARSRRRTGRMRTATIIFG